MKTNSYLMIGALAAAVLAGSWAYGGGALGPRQTPQWRHDHVQRDQTPPARDRVSPPPTASPAPR